MNFPVVTTTNQIPQIPSEFAAKLRAMFDQDFTGLGASNFRRIKVRKLDFELQGGAEGSVEIPANGLVGVFIAANPVDHCVWYEKSFQPGQEPESPDLVWLRHTPDTFPDALPTQFRQKVMREGAERWAFQTLRRTIWALARPDAVTGQLNIDFDQPYCFDVSSMSMYGNTPAPGTYKLGGLRALCNRYSSPSFTCTPSMFLTQILIDTSVSQSGVVVFRPQTDQMGNLVYLDWPLIEAAYNCRVNEDTQELLTIREKLTYGTAVSIPTPATVEPVSIPTPATVEPVSIPTPAPVEPVSIPTPATVEPQVFTTDNGSMDLLKRAQELLASQGSQVKAETVSSSDKADLVKASIDSLLTGLNG